MDLRSLLQGLPSVIQYVAVLGIVMLLLYICLTLTRILGQRFGKKQYYDDPEAYDKTVPDPFSVNRKSRKKEDAGDAESKDSD